MIILFCATEGALRLAAVLVFYALTTTRGGTFVVSVHTVLRVEIIGTAFERISRIHSKHTRPCLACLSAPVNHDAHLTRAVPNLHQKQRHFKPN